MDIEFGFIRYEWFTIIYNLFSECLYVAPVVSWINDHNKHNIA